MAGSPFEVFRRNQRQLLVVLTGMAMFAFIFMDSVSMRTGEMPRSLNVILIAAICAAGMWFVGNPRGKGNELALYGALIGGVIAFFGLRAAGQQPVAITAIGNFTREDLMGIAQRRQLANQFVQLASKGTNGGFGGVDDAALVQKAILQNEAEKRGINVSSDAVSKFISQVSNNQLSQADYKKILRDLQLPETDLYEILSEELAARLAFEMDMPPIASSERALPQTPLTYWKQYKMLQVREALDVAPIPVESFVAKVPEPNDTELLGFFERYKAQLPNPTTGEPGFLIDRKVNLGYVAADFEAFERQVKEPTDEEVAAYYEANKQNYRVFDLPDNAGEATEDAPASAVTPENAPTPELPAPEMKTEAPASTETPAADAPKADPAKTETPKPDTPAEQPEAKPETPAEPAKPEPTPEPAAPSNEAAARQSSQGIPVRLVSFQQESETAPAAATPAAGDKPATGDKPANGDKPAAESKPTESATEPPAATETPKAETPASETLKTESPAATPKLNLPPGLSLPPGVGGGMFDSFPPSPGQAPRMPEPKFRDLDDGLKLEIRETILRDRAFEAMGAAVDKAFDEMMKLADEYLNAVDKEAQTAAAEDMTTRLKAYARANKLIYSETGLMTREQLQSSVSETIGAASEPTANPFQRGEPVSQTAFANQTLYYPARADSLLRDKRYAYWKVADQPQRVAELSEVKAAVTSAWKEAQARPLAEKRAQELAELVKKSDKPLTETLAGQTITGAQDGTPVTVRETPRFSWMTTPRNLPFQFNQSFMPPPQRSQIDGVSQPGEDFMRTVFDVLGPDETGVAPNEPKSIYYVVHVKQRDATPSEGSDNLGLKALQQQFMNDGRSGFDEGPYAYLGYPELIELFGNWRKGYEAQHAVQWEESETAALSDE